MRKLLSLIFILSALSINAQTEGSNMSVSERPVVYLQFGYLDYSEMVKRMPAYNEGMEKVKQLRANFQKEMNRAQEEFNSKYEEFLQEQASLMPAIRRKRQVELEDLLNSNKQFREEARQMLEKSEAEALKPARVQLNAIVERIALEMNLAFVLNTATDTCPYIHPDRGVDISTTVITVLEQTPLE